MDSTSSAASPNNADSGASSTVYDATKYGAATSNLREPDAVDAMELGARRMDFIGLKFQLADEMAAGYARALAASTSTDRKTRATVSRELSDLNGINGRIQDLRNGTTLLRDLYESAWLRSNRPYWLRNILEQYDYATQLWLARADKVRSAQRQWTESKSLPTARGAGHSARTRGNPCARSSSNSRGHANSRSGDRAMTTTLLTARRLITPTESSSIRESRSDADGTIAGIESGEPQTQKPQARKRPR